MQLSILLPTNRHGPVAISRIAQVCSWATPSIEVIVRDNSGNAEKRALIAHFRNDYCRVESVDPCEPLQNYSEILNLATGEFVFWLADDDQCFDHAIGALPGLIDRYGKDFERCGLYRHLCSRNNARHSFRQLQGHRFRRYSGPCQRILTYPGPNMLFYSVIRRSVSKRMARFLQTLPTSFVPRSDCMSAAFAQWKTDTYAAFVLCL